VVGGLLYSSNDHRKALNQLVQEHKVELKNENIKHLQDIAERNKKIIELEGLVKKDSTTISSLKDQILKHNRQVEADREAASKFTPDEKKSFLLNRYNYPSDTIR